MLSQQPDEEVSPAEVAVGELLQPGPHLGLDLHRVQASHALNAICVSCYSKVMLGSPAQMSCGRRHHVPEAMYAARM